MSFIETSFCCCCFVLLLYLVSSSMREKIKEWERERERVINCNLVRLVDANRAQKSREKAKLGQIK